MTSSSCDEEDESDLNIDESLESTYLSSTFKHTFNLASLRRQYPVDECVYTESWPDVAKFLHVKQVYLSFFPNGKEESQQDNCALYLWLHPLSSSSRNDESKFAVTVRFCVMDEVTNQWNQGGTFAQMQPEHIVSSGETCQFFREEVNLCKLSHLVSDKLTVQVNLKAFTKTTFNRTASFPPLFGSDPSRLFEVANQFDNQSFPTGQLVVVEVYNDKKECIKTFNASKDILCNAGVPFNIGLTKNEWKKDKNYQTFETFGNSPSLVHYLLKSIHTGMLFGCDDLDGGLEMLKIADEFQVHWIKSRVSGLVEEEVNIENVLQCYARSYLSNVCELKKKCFKLCVKKYHKLRKTEEWKLFKQQYRDLAFDVTEEVADRNPCPSKRVRK